MLYQLCYEKLTEASNPSLGIPDRIHDGRYRVTQRWVTFVSPFPCRFETINVSASLRKLNNGWQKLNGTCRDFFWSSDIISAESEPDYELNWWWVRPQKLFLQIIWRKWYQVSDSVTQWMFVGVHHHENRSLAPKVWLDWKIRWKIREKNRRDHRSIFMHC